MAASKNTAARKTPKKPPQADLVTLVAHREKQGQRLNMIAAGCLLSQIVGLVLEVVTIVMLARLGGSLSVVLESVNYGQ